MGVNFVNDNAHFHGISNHFFINIILFDTHIRFTDTAAKKNYAVGILSRYGRVKICMPGAA